MTKRMNVNEARALDARFVLDEVLTTIKRWCEECNMYYNLLK